MSLLDDAEELKAVAVDFGLRVKDLRSVPSTNRFLIALDDRDDPDRLYVHASPVKMTIELERHEGETASLTYEEALETMLVAIGR